MLGCDPTVIALAANWPRRSRPLRAAGMNSGRRVEAEVGNADSLELVEQSASHGELLVNEWIRLEGSFGTSSGGYDFEMTIA